MTRGPSLTAQALQELGAIGARQEAQAERLDAIERTMAEDRHAAADNSRRVLAKLDALNARLGEKHADHDRRLAGLELFRNRVGAVVALAGAGVTLLGGGLWYLVSHFWSDLITLVRRLLP